jgi:hypothetical protein
MDNSTLGPVRRRRRTVTFAIAVAAVTGLSAGTLSALAATPGVGVVAGGPVGARGAGSAGGGPQAAPAAVADYYPVAYRSHQILRSARIDTTRNTVTLPLHRGRLRDGRAVWYVLTDTSDPAAARRLGISWSAKLAQVPADAARLAVRARDGSLVFDAGVVDFRPERRVVPGAAPAFFPPTVAEPGSVGDADYTPLVRVAGGGPGGGNGADTVFNATVVAFDVAARQIEFPRGGVDHDLVIDRAVAISPAAGTVTFAMSLGTASAHPVLFVSLDSNSPLVSALEATTYAPRLSRLPVGRDSAPDSAVAVNYVLENGPTGVANPQRQGLASALGDAGAQVLDVFSTVPGVVRGDDYSPMWDLYVTSWTAAAVAAGYRARLNSELAVVGLAQQGWLTSLGGGPLGASGLISNCPLLASF